MLLKKMVFAEYKVKLFKIFLPIMLSQLISQIQMVIDRIFLGYVIDFINPSLSIEQRVLERR